jgi:hypothetical protein
MGRKSVIHSRLMREVSQSESLSEDASDGLRKRIGAASGSTPIVDIKAYQIRDGNVCEPQ